MNLNCEDVYSNIESFKNKHGYTLDKMAELTGMSDKSAYSGMIKNRRMKLEYLITLINNTELTLEQVFRLSTKQQPYKNDDPIQFVEDGCALCREKDKRINDKEEIIRGLNKHIELLELSLGKSRKNGSE